MQKGKVASKVRMNTVALVLVCFTLVFGIFLESFNIGKVQAAGPIVIKTAKELDDIRHDLTADYVLGADIDLNIAPYNAGKGWEKIGGRGNQGSFKGTFDGKGHTISGLMINENSDATGLFGSVSGSAKIVNVKLVNVNVVAGHSVGALVGEIGNGGLLENITVTGTVSGADTVGGIVGNLTNAKIKNSHANITVIGRNDGRAGGLVGVAGGDGALIEKSTSAGSVTGGGSEVGGLAASATYVKDSSSSAKVVGTRASNHNAVGGLIGRARPFSGEITNSFATGDVESISENVGGLIGHLSINGTRIEVTNSYATGTVSGKNQVGGLIGNLVSPLSNLANVVVKDSYATGDVYGEKKVGGFVGSQSGENGILQKVFATGKVTATEEDGGGLIGHLAEQAKVQDAYARGDVIGKNNIGGFVGNNVASTIERTYATGHVTGDNNVGGLVGKELNGKYSKIAANYYDAQTTGQTDSKGGTGLPTATMKDIAKKEATYANWNFKSVWDMEPNDYPIFALFSDINELPWAKDKIKEATEKGYFSGYPDGTFKPRNPITRAEFAVIISRALDLDGTGDAPAFTDQDKIPAWAEEAIEEVYRAGIVVGDASGTFRPNDKIRRTEIAVMTAKAFELQRTSSGSTGFADDGRIPAWAKDYVAALKDNEIIQGKGGNNFAPLDDTIRAEGAIILLKSLE